MNSISPLSHIPPVGSSTSDSGGKPKHQQARHGQVFKALVVEAKGANIFTLEIGGNKVPAESKTPLTIGQTLDLQVVATSPKVELRVLSDSTKLFQGKLITLMGESINLKELLTSISGRSPSPLDSLTSFSKQTLESYFAFNQNSLTGKDGGELLKQFIERLGLRLETFLAQGDKVNSQNSLKSALFELSKIFQGADDIAESTNKLLNTLELYQHAQLQLDKDNIFIFPLPLPFLEKGYLLVEHHDKNSESEENDEDRFSLHMSLHGLGNLRVDILKNSEGIYIRFVSSSREKLQFIEEFKDSLLLQMIDADLLGISFSVEKTDPAADLLKMLIPSGESIVNTTV